MRNHPADLFRVASLSLVAWLIGGTHSAHAEFQVCNKTLDFYNVAIGVAEDGLFRTRGWWAITPEKCIPLIKEPLSNRYLYIYATDISGSPVISGDTQMCVDRKKFSILGTQECWQRGHEKVGFTEVDTGAFEKWTVFLQKNE